MRKRRIFIAINLSDKIKRELIKFQREWSALPVRWVKANNLHLTMVFIGHVTDEETLEICRLVREITQKHQPFEIIFEKICLGPYVSPNRPACNAMRSIAGRPPRLIWLEGKENKPLANLKNDLEKQLLNSAKSGFNRLEARAFRPHITIGRIRQREWRQMPDKPIIDKNAPMSFIVESVEVMQSNLARSGAEYAVLESVNLGD